MKKLLLTIRDVACILLLVIAAQIVAGIQIPSLENNHIFTLVKSDFIAGFIYAGVFYLGFIWLKKKVYKADFKAISWPPKFKLRYFGYAFGLIAIISILLIFMTKVEYPKLNQYEFSQNLVSLVFISTLTAPFVEEIAFRGVIFEQVAKRYNLKTGLVVSSILFGMVHLLNGKLNFTSAIQLVVSGTLMGMLLGVAYFYEKSIWANYTIHACYNLFFGIFPFQIGVTHDWPIEFIFKTNNQLLTGGQYGMDCSLANIVGYTVLIFVVVYLIRKRKIHVK